MKAFISSFVTGCHGQGREAVLMLRAAYLLVSVTSKSHTSFVKNLFNKSKNSNYPLKKCHIHAYEVGTITVVCYFSLFYINTLKLTMQFILRIVFLIFQLYIFARSACANCTTTISINKRIITDYRMNTDGFTQASQLPRV